MQIKMKHFLYPHHAKLWFCSVVKLCSKNRCAGPTHDCSLFSLHLFGDIVAAHSAYMRIGKYTYTPLGPRVLAAICWSPMQCIVCAVLWTSSSLYRAEPSVQLHELCLFPNEVIVHLGLCAHTNVSSYAFSYHFCERMHFHTHCICLLSSHFFQDHLCQSSISSSHNHRCIL